MKRSIALFSTLLALCGCGGPGELSQEYAKNVRKVGIFPIYPPREDFQIGDVYAWSQSRTNGNDTMAVYIGSVDWLRKKADDFMLTRVVFDNTIANEQGKPPSRTFRDIPEGKTGLSTRSEVGFDSDLARSLPIAAFPSITADSGFTAGIGIVRLLAAIGLAGGSRTQVRLNFHDVRTYWVPNVEIARAAIDARDAIYNERQDVTHFELRRMAAYRLGQSVDPCRGDRHCGISVVTRVYMTRKIDYTYFNARIIAGGLRAAETGSARAKVAAAPSVNINVTTTDTGQIQGVTDAQIAEIRKQIDAVTASESQGASLRFEAWDARGMTFASEFMRPVVVGWDGLTGVISLDR